MQVTALDILPKRAAMWQAVNRGGFDNLTILQEDICTWQGTSNSFDVVTLLEVLEHIPQVELAIKNAVRLTKKYVIVSVPSKPDDNPEHIHLLTQPILTDLFAQSGCTKIRFQEVHEHLIAMVEKEQI